MIESMELFNNQAIHFAHNGEYKEAIACLKKALQFEQENSHLWLNLGITYRDSGDFFSAKSALKKAIRFAREYGETGEEEIEVMAQMLFSQGDFASALHYCAIGINSNQENSHLWNILGVIFFNMKDYEKAASAFENAVSIEPYYCDALYNLRDTYSELGNAGGVRDCEMILGEINYKE